jgi:hypothetical protein
VLLLEAVGAVTVLEVADYSPPTNAQPRVRVLETVERILASTPDSYSHHDLARAVYVSTEPTAAQLSAVRRAVARLVADGKAIRGGRVGGDTGGHDRHYRNHIRECSNPRGVVIRRAPTETDRARTRALLDRITARMPVVAGGERL